MWLPLLPFNKLMKEKIPWEGELPLGTGPFVGFGPPLKIDPQLMMKPKEGYKQIMEVSLSGAQFHKDYFEELPRFPDFFVTFRIIR